MSITLKIKKLKSDAIIPKRGSAKASGLDLHSLEHHCIQPGQTVLVTTGIAMEIPEGYEIQVRARSGISLKTKIRVANGVGTVDQDYTGDISVILHNLGDSDYYISPGDRIAQAVLCPVVLPDVEEVSSLRSEERGENGLGSTGI